MTTISRERKREIARNASAQCGMDVSERVRPRHTVQKCFRYSESECYILTCIAFFVVGWAHTLTYMRFRTFQSSLYTFDVGFLFICPVCGIHSCWYFTVAVVIHCPFCSAVSRMYLLLFSVFSQLIYLVVVLRVLLLLLLLLLLLMWVDAFINISYSFSAIISRSCLTLTSFVFFPSLVLAHL